MRDFLSQAEKPAISLAPYRLILPIYECRLSSLKLPFAAALSGGRATPQLDFPSSSDAPKAVIAWGLRAGQ
jgi:hypothetical protein